MYPSLLNRLMDQHQGIRPLIQHLDINRLSGQPVSGKWSIKDNIAHLARYQPVFLDRVHSILTQDAPVFERYKAEDDPQFESWRQYPVPELLDRIEDDRKTIYTSISGLTAAQISRTGFHKKFGALTMTQWAEFFLLHEAHHLFSIFQLAHDAQLR